MTEELAYSGAPDMQSEDLISTAELTGKRVVTAAGKRIGKVRAFVFHPAERRCVGFIVKRPDAALMFHRKDLFVAFDSYDQEDGRLVVCDEKGATDTAACKRLGVVYDRCVLWVGLPVMTADETMLGYVGSVNFNAETGEVASIETDGGATANTLLGRRLIPAEFIRGFQRGIGMALREEYEEDGEQPVLGALLVTDEARACDTVGGVAEKAGAASAIALDKAHHAAGKAGEAVDKGVRATGKQIGKAQGMFSDFKEEYDKARGPKPETVVLEDGTEAKVIEEVAEYIEVDEDGNEIEGSATRTVTRKVVRKKATSHAAGKAVGSHLKAAGGMFSAFKDEYDKARHD